MDTPFSSALPSIAPPAYSTLTYFRIPELSSAELPPYDRPPTSVVAVSVDPLAVELIGALPQRTMPPQFPEEGEEALDVKTIGFDAVPSALILAPCWIAI